MGILRKISIEAHPSSRTYLKGHHYPEKAWKQPYEYDRPASLAFDQLSEALENAASVTLAANSVKAVRMKANLTARAAYLDDWERRLKHREKQVVESEDALEGMAMLYTKRSVTVLRALRTQWGREAACWWHHGAGLLLLALIVGCFVTIAVHWQIKDWQCSAWSGLACWGVMGYTMIAGMSYITRIWIEERATDSKHTGAFVFACLLPFIHFLTCLSAALWSVGIGSMCHAH